MKEWVLGNIILMKDHAEKGGNYFQEITNLKIFISKFKRWYTESCLGTKQMCDTFVIFAVIHICDS